LLRTEDSISIEEWQEEKRGDPFSLLVTVLYGIILSLSEQIHTRQEIAMLLEDLKQHLTAIKNSIETLRRHL
jgi:hypothetical protein